MGKIKKFQGVKLITSIFSNEKELFDKVISILQRKFGPLDFESDFLPFNKISYYDKEMGLNLMRKFYSFKKLIRTDKIADIKIYTNKLEEKFSVQNKRKVNIDPGYLTLGKLILATTKNQQQRIYLREGIYAEVSLRYKDKGYIPWEWTYPDYATDEYREIFNKIRKNYKKQIR